MHASVAARRRNRRSRRVPGYVAVRAPQLQLALRSYTLGAFAFLLRELEAVDGQLPFAFEEHVGRAGPALYEYRPLVRGFIEERADRLRDRDDALIALDELRREPATAIYARAHAGARPSEDDALFRTVLLDLLVRVAEACGGFDWDDEAFEREYDELDRSLGERRTYASVAPLVGISCGAQLELAPGLRVRAVADAELSRHWPEAQGLLPPGFGREADRYCVLELRAALGDSEDVPDAPTEIADAVSALRLATAAPLAAGPVLFETLDGRPFGIRPMLPIAATLPPGEPTRLDEFRGALAGEFLARLGLADTDTALAEALDRWELSLFQHDPFRSEQLRAAMTALLGATWPLRATVLLESEAGRRGVVYRDLSTLDGGGEATLEGQDAVRRALVEALRRADRMGLQTDLDRELLGLGAPGVLSAVVQRLDVG